MFPPTIIFRHQRENLKKCSLSGLEERPDLCFYTYPKDTLPVLYQSYVLLAFDGPPLSLEDSCKGLLLIDGTWRYAEKMCEQLHLPSSIEKRSLPQKCQTAYPRYQTGCPIPARGLSSLEALYVAYLILQRDVSSLLNRYYWKEAFLSKNRTLFETHPQKIT